jgi:hypothetical protein
VFRSSLRSEFIDGPERTNLKFIKETNSIKIDEIAEKFNLSEDGWRSMFFKPIDS